MHGTAQKGVSGGGEKLPHLDTVQAAFGHHDVTGVSAHVGGAAEAASEALGAQAYAIGNDVAFKSAPDLHTTAHEAAHVVQQRGGVSLKGGVGESGDSYEQHADQVADAVVAGQGVQGLLDQVAPRGGDPQSSSLQLKANLSADQGKTGGKVTLQDLATRSRRPIR